MATRINYYTDPDRNELSRKAADEDTVMSSPQRLGVSAAASIARARGG